MTFLILMKTCKTISCRLFLVGISKKGIKFYFWMVNLLKNNFPGTLQAILYQINWSNFWGQIKPTYLLNGSRYLNFLCIPFVNVSTKKKNRYLYHVFERRYSNFSSRTYFTLLVILTSPTVQVTLYLTQLCTIRYRSHFTWNHRQVQVILYLEQMYIIRYRSHFTSHHCTPSGTGHTLPSHRTDIIG